MYVRNHMQKEVFTINADFKISEALNLMANHDLHRLPVVNGSKLIGLITAGVISEHSPSKASSLSIHEMNYLLSKMSVRDIMIKDVITVYPDALLEEAAYIMRQNEIGCLPVIDTEFNLVGIITINDVINAFIDILGFFNDGVRLEILIEKNNVGVLADITATFARTNMSISRLSVIQEGNNFIIMILTVGTNTKVVEDELKKQGYIIRDRRVFKKD